MSARLRKLEEENERLRESCYVPEVVSEVLGSLHPYQNSADACVALCALVESLRGRLVDAQAAFHREMELKAAALQRCYELEDRIGNGPSS